MSTLSQYLGTASMVGDIKPRALRNAARDDSLIVIEGQHWLKTGTFIAYDSSLYGHLVTSSPELLRMGYVATLSRAAWDGSRYLHCPSSVWQVRSTWDGADTATTSGPNNAATLILVSSGANAGRTIAIDNNSNKTLDAGATAWANSSATLGTTKGATKPDGSLVMACASTIGTSAGDIHTSANAGTSWTSRTPSGISGTTCIQAHWSALLNAFLVAQGSIVFNTTDGFNFASTYDALTGGSSSWQSGQRNVFAESASALLVARATNTVSPVIYRYKAGSWSLLSSAPRSVCQVLVHGSNFYAVGDNRIWRSTDDGVTWDEAYRSITTLDVSTDVRVVNGRVIVAGTFDGAEDPVGATPKAVGVPSATASLPGSSNDYANFVRIK